ncbi:F0F1 ATP synthase subunit delta [Komagataeibacter rhaeticus]|uniref:ATP synthase subunit delta n=1 Tax=Komagataeibacter rhaeticus TaxID=215221 RepID=A0A858JQM1_9PROT|nr:F0F1 ATP synthase subunit delta [Komagataeibacter rhaeticus]ATU71632.1 F0F1 ATP synthase subunit delta [Komagataeibacter xylinus]QIP36307.1 F0F1 ATP synthase subunit delta [Komagataeibacter rhaeticus]QOC46072.1 F0F1 ATP synthase subunit delta [Komagataeibacter rhaeticus]WPP21327.1 F0F1 ATP synthase subunit delta [Komagataeibacter rhaeticus]
MEKRTVDSGGTTSIPIASIANGLPGRYATALYELAAERQQLDPVLDEASRLAAMIDGSADLRTVLTDRTLDIRDSRRGVAAVLVAEGFSPLMRDFVGVVADNRRLPRLREILAALAAIAAARRGEVVADVVSAHPLTDLQRVQLRSRLTEAGYSKVNIQERVDAALLGGLVVRIGARLYDASLRSRLTRLHHAMKGAA